MEMNGSQILLEVLLEHNVDTIFGYPGGTILNVYDALYDYKDKIQHVLTAHEQGAAHAADGYARASGKTGVVFATSGPGATNLVTGIATAFMDSIPMVAITANVGSNLIGRDAFQEICITGVTLPITKHNFFVNRIEDLVPALRDAFRIANEGRKGPVLVDITKDVTAAMYDYEPKKPVKVKKLAKPPQFVAEEIALMIKTSKRPLIYFGGGVVSGNASKELVALVEKADIYATHTIMGTGVLGYDHPKNLGMLGMHGKVAANAAVQKADLVIALGTRFSDRVALNTDNFAKDAIRVQIDIDNSEINKNVHVDLGVCAEIKDMLKMVLPLVETQEHSEWDTFIEKQKKRERLVKAKPGNMHPSEIITCICDHTDKETIYTTDVGQHQMWAAQYIKHKKTKQFITSGGLGTMGFGYGAAIGAQMAFPKKRVIHITGDGSFHMNMNEASTAVSQGLPIITIIMNNKVLGMVYQWQGVFYHKRYSQTTVKKGSDYVKLAEGFGAVGFRATTLKEFEEAYKKALKVNGPVWIECVIDKEERVLPMIPNGGTVDEIIID
ncbi:MAG: biosynthetic-type acetolactate synthase large subunit [Erysipelotrichia bacterium]|nr:biosynthetic-type acetolactate synthase large subunit [Erysipelotrichia bacterium]NCC54104.1 biosynthetic-type acetolactate synthase large subunit [Erysipelotrichia bacterium]